MTTKRHPNNYSNVANRSVLERTRRTLYYPVIYLLSGGLAMIVAPNLALSLFLARGDYGEVFPRFAGVLTVGLGLIVLQIVRHRQAALYTSLIGVRLLLCGADLVLGLHYREPLFGVLFVMIGLGAAATSIAWMKDRQAPY